MPATTADGARSFRNKGCVAAYIAPLLIPDIEAARVCGISRATLHRLRAAGQFPPGVKLGRALRFKLSDLETFVACDCDVVRWRALQEQIHRPNRIVR